MKLFLAAVIFGCSFTCFGQAGNDKNISVYVKGYKGQSDIDTDHFTKVDIDYLRKGFKIELSDTSFHLISFRFTIDQGNTIYEWIISGDSINPHLKQFDLKNLELESFLTIEDIKVEFEGRIRKMVPIIITPKDLFNKYPTLNNPSICHNMKNQLTCYNDGTYKIDIIGNRINSIDFLRSNVIYFESEKIFEIKSANESDNMPVYLQLKPDFVSLGYGDEYREIDTIRKMDINFGGLSFSFRPYHNGRFGDTIFFSSAGKDFKILISREKKRWRWNISENNYSNEANIFYSYKHNRLRNISIRNDSQKYGMSLSTRFKTQKGIWLLESEYIESKIEGEKQYIYPLTLSPSYYYKYNIFGKLKKNKSSGKIVNCLCQ